MKRYFAILAVAIAAIMSSCTNEDIPVRETTVLRVNPSTVLKDITYQLNPGDLDGVGSTQELRIRLFIYDVNGKLVSEQTQSVKNYYTTASFEVNLETDQNYTAIALTDVTDSKSGNVSEYWGIEGESEISSLKVNYLGSDSNYGDQEILGVKSMSIRSGENATINVELAGAVICTCVMNLHAYSDVSYIQVFGNRGNGYYDFSSARELNSNPDLDVTPYFTKLTLSEKKSNYYSYSYKFLMPQTNYTITISFLDSSEKEIVRTKDSGLTFNKGREYLYLAYLDYDDEGTYSTGVEDVTGKTLESAVSSVQSKAIQYESGINSERKETDSWSVLELIK